MPHEDYIKEAINVAKEAEQNGGIAIGAVMVKDGKVIAKGGSTVWVDKDPSEHGESNCIREACKKLSTTDLNGCTLYGTLEPCGMCLSASAWANLSEIYFGAYREDAIGNNYEINEWSAEKASKNMRLFSGKSMKVNGGILREECADLLKGYTNWEKQ